MSYDLFTFRLPPGADPEDYATEVVESFDQEVEPGASDPSVAELVAAFRAVFPNAELGEQDDDSAMVLLEDRRVSIELWPSHSEVCVSYSESADGAWLTVLLEGIRKAAADAGHDTLFDAQLGRPIDPADPADAADIGELWTGGLSIVAGLHDGDDPEPRGGRDAPRPGLLGRLFGRR